MARKKKSKVQIPKELLDSVPPELAQLVDRVPPEWVLVGGALSAVVQQGFALAERAVVALEKIAKEVALPRTEH